MESTYSYYKQTPRYFADIAIVLPLHAAKDANGYVCNNVHAKSIGFSSHQKEPSSFQLDSPCFIIVHCKIEFHSVIQTPAPILNLRLHPLSLFFSPLCLCIFLPLPIHTRPIILPASSKISRSLLSNAIYAPRCDERGNAAEILTAEAVENAKNAEIAVVFAGLPARLTPKGVTGTI